MIAHPSEGARLLEQLLERFARVRVAHTPTPLEPAPRLGAELGLELLVKRDDCTGLAFGGNKVRQLEFYLGDALAAGADALLITGAVQSNFVRTTAAMACRFGLECHVQLEERVPGTDALHNSSGNVLLDRLFGARLYRYLAGDDEAGADASLHEIAARLRKQKRRPYVIPLGPEHAPIGALGYVEAAGELLQQLERQGLQAGEVVVPSGSAATHAGLLWGLRAASSDLPVIGMCVRRDAGAQARRVAQRFRDIGALCGHEVRLRDGDVRVFDEAHPPGYGRMSEVVTRAISIAARTEGLVLDPVYTGKTLAGLILAAGRRGVLASRHVVFVHTGGQPALFAYGDAALRDGGRDC